jgi:hypothetical protein
MNDLEKKLDTNEAPPPEVDETSDDIRGKIGGLDEDLKRPEPPPAADEKRPEPPPAADEKRDEPGDDRDPNLTRRLRRDLEEANRKIRELEKAAKKDPPAPPVNKEGAAGDERDLGNRRQEPEKKDPPPEKQTPEQRRADNEQAFLIFEKATRALNGEVVRGMETHEKAKEVHSLALEVIRGMTAEELVEIQQRAEKGAFGDAGQAIIDAAARELTAALGKTHVEETKARKAEQARAETAKVISGAMEQVHAKYPSLRPVEGHEPTPELKFAKDWFEKNVGTDKEPGIFFDALAKDPARNIPKLFDRMMDEFQASRHTAVIAERDNLRKRLDSQINPEGATRPGSGGEVTGSAAILHELRGRGVEID